MNAKVIYSELAISFRIRKNNGNKCYLKDGGNPQTTPTAQVLQPDCINRHKIDLKLRYYSILNQASYEITMSPDDLPCLSLESINAFEKIAVTSPARTRILGLDFSTAAELYFS